MIDLGLLLLVGYVLWRQRRLYRDLMGLSIAMSGNINDLNAAVEGLMTHARKHDIELNSVGTSVDRCENRLHDIELWQDETRQKLEME